MENIDDFKIITEHLILVPINIIYKDTLFKEFTPEVARFLTPQPTGNIENTIFFINDSRGKTIRGEELQLIALNKGTNEFLGCIGLHEINTKQPELGIWFKKSAWGKGYGKESMLALKQWADNNLDYEDIAYPVFKENIPSRKIAEFLGGIIIAELKSKNQNGMEFDEVKYIIKRN
ncbi:MAG: GNAT family N-acetyltransferase [Patescibacteria group bacterium]